MVDNKTDILKEAAEISHEKDEHGKTLWYYAWQRLKQNKLAFGSGIVLVLMILLILVGPLFSPYAFDYIDWEYMSIPPDFVSKHYFGTDALGRDLFVRTLHGGRISLMVGFVATFVSLVIGITYGSISGYMGGRTDNIMMRICLLYTSDAADE